MIDSMVVTLTRYESTHLTMYGGDAAHYHTTFIDLLGEWIIYFRSRFDKLAPRYTNVMSLLAAC